MNKIKKGDRKIDEYLVLKWKDLSIVIGLFLLTSLSCDCFKNMESRYE